MTGKIFLNYRRADSKGFTFAIFTVLEQHFSKEQIFMDVDTLLPGVDFVQALEEAVESCDVFLAVIGLHWENIKDKQGQRRIDNPKDFVRIEVAHALKRGIPVIPILVDGAQMPSPENLPDDLKRLSRRHAFIISDRLRSDMQHLISVLEKTFEHQEEERVKQEKKEANRQELEKAEADRKAKEEVEQKAKVQAAADKKDNEEKERIARQKAEADRQAREKADAVQKSLEQAELKAKEEERVVRQTAEAEHQAGEKVEEDHQAQEKAESVPGVARQPATADVQQENIDTLQSPFTRKRASLLRKVPAWMWVGSVLALVLMVFGAAGGFKLTPADEPTPTEVVLVLEVLTKTQTLELATSTPIPSATVTPTVTFTVIPTDTPTPAFPAGTEATNRKDSAVMIYVPPGDFKMGTYGSAYKEALHTVYLDGYWMYKTEVTNAMYRLCVESGGCTEPVDNGLYEMAPLFGWGDRPVESVSWEDATTYCQWAENRLPTEAEWEKAARGTDGRTYPWGEGIDPSLALYDNYIEGNTTLVGSYPEGASPYGLLDMAGNVWEWVADWYGSNYYQNSPAENPPGPEGGVNHVLRGGGLNSSREEVRSAYRQEGLSYVIGLGFRCASSTKP